MRSYPTLRERFPSLREPRSRSPLTEQKEKDIYLSQGKRVQDIKINYCPRGLEEYGRDLQHPSLHAGGWMVEKNRNS